MLLLAQITPLADLSRVAYHWIFKKIHFIITLHSSIAATSASQYKKKNENLTKCYQFLSCLVISCPAFSCPAVWFIIFMSVIFSAPVKTLVAKTAHYPNQRPYCPIWVGCPHKVGNQCFKIEVINYFRSCACATAVRTVGCR